MKKVKLGNKTYNYTTMTYKRALSCWRAMKTAWENGEWLDPELFRSTNRIFYHRITEDGLEHSGYSSIPMSYHMSKKEWRVLHDIEDDHFTAPEMVARFIYAHGEEFFNSEEQFENKFLGYFVWTKQVHMVSGECNRKLSNTSGIMKPNSNKYQRFPECTIADKYPTVGITEMYDTNNKNSIIPVNEACPVPQELTAWQIQSVVPKSKNLWEL